MLGATLFLKLFEAKALSTPQNFVGASYVDNQKPL